MPQETPTEIEQFAAAEDRALGTSLRIVVTRPASLDAARAAVDAVLRDVDRAASRFRDDSELAGLNAAAGRETPVSALLARAIAEALRGARLTDGDVDPTVGVALRLIGYDVDFGVLARDGAALHLDVQPVPGWRSVRLNAVTRSVSFPRGVELDLGATAKALAADLAATAALAAMAGGGGVLVSLGGDIAVAGAPPEGGWTIQISEDSNDPLDDRSEKIRIQGGGVATSSTQVRRWRRGGVELHHIIDPRTGTPADGPWRLATVVADTCVDANIASTAAIVRGRRAEGWLRSLGLPARLVAHDGRVLRVAGWPAPDGPDA